MLLSLPAVLYEHSCTPLFVIDFVSKMFTFIDLFDSIWYPNLDSTKRLHYTEFQALAYVLHTGLWQTDALMDTQFHVSSTTRA